MKAVSLEQQQNSYLSLFCGPFTVLFCLCAIENTLNSYTYMLCVCDYLVHTSSLCSSHFYISSVITVQEEEKTYIERKV